MKVNVISDNRSWILKRMATESINHPDIEGVVSRKVDPTADINYFVNYALFKPVATPVACYFTHFEDKFASEWKRAERACSGAVFMAHRYKPNCKLSVFIPPTGLDYQHEDFTIGIVGAQYTNGRKGEDRILEIANALKDLPICWHFHGGNWHILKDLREIDSNHSFKTTEWKSDKDSIEFYKNINLYFTAAKLEGGPVPALEAAKVGCEMLTFDVGNTELWGEFSNIVTSVDEAISFIRAKVELHEKRRKLCEYNWQAFSDRHYELFMRMLNEKSK